MSPGSPQKAILEHFQAQAAEWPQEASRKLFWSISKPRPQNGSRKLPEIHFGVFPSPGRRMGPGSIQKPFLRISKPRPQNGPRRLPERYFGAFPSPGRRMGRGSFQTIILKHFQAQVPEWAQEASRRPFWSISKSRPQNGPRKPPEHHFGALPSPSRRMGPGSLQKPTSQ